MSEVKRKVAARGRIEGGNGKLTKPRWDLRLYVAGETPRSRRAIESLRQICREHLEGECRLEVIDLRKDPALARGDQIVAVPTLVRKLPPPLKRIIGDLSNAKRVLVGLDLRDAKKDR
jgi:circadian clock protein KaiB